MKRIFVISLVCLSALLAGCNKPAESLDSSSGQEASSGSSSHQDATSSVDEEAKYQVEAAQVTAIFEPSRTRNFTIEMTEKAKPESELLTGSAKVQIVADAVQVKVAKNDLYSSDEGCVFDVRIDDFPEGKIWAEMDYVAATPDFVNPPYHDVQRRDETVYPDALAVASGQNVLPFAGLFLKDFETLFSCDEAAFKGAFAYDASLHAYKASFPVGAESVVIEVAFLDQVLQKVTVLPSKANLINAANADPNLYFSWSYSAIGSTEISYLAGEKEAFLALIDQAAYQGESFDSGWDFSCVTIQSKAYLTKGGKQYGQFDVSIGSNGDARFLMQHFDADGVTVKDSKTILMRMDAENGKWADLVFPTDETVSSTHLSASHGNFTSYAAEDCNIKGIYTANYLVYDLDPFHRDLQVAAVYDSASHSYVTTKRSSDNYYDYKVEEHLWMSQKTREIFTATPFIGEGSAPFLYEEINYSGYDETSVLLTSAEDARLAAELAKEA